MENPLNNKCKPNEHYNKSTSAMMLGISRPTLDSYIKQGRIKLSYHKASSSLRIKGTELIKYYNSIS